MRRESLRAGHVWVFGLAEVGMDPDGRARVLYERHQPDVLAYFPVREAPRSR